MKKPVKMQRFVESHSVSKAGTTLHGLQQSAFQEGLWEPGTGIWLGLLNVSVAEGAAAQRELNKEQEPACMCLSLSQGALILRSPFHLCSQPNRGSGLAFCVYSELPCRPVPTSSSASSHALQSAAAPRKGPGTDGLISADKGAAFKGEARWKPSGLISLFLVLSTGG